MKTDLKSKARDYLKMRCDNLSPTKRKWVLLTMFGLFVTIFLYNLICEFL